MYISNLTKRNQQQCQNQNQFSKIFKLSANQINLQLQTDPNTKLFKKAEKLLKQKTRSQLANTNPKQLIDLAIFELDWNDLSPLIKSLPQNVQKPSEDYLVVKSMINEYLQLVKLKIQPNSSRTSTSSQFALKPTRLQSFNLQNAFNLHKLVEFLNIWNEIMLEYLNAQQKQFSLKNYARIFQIPDLYSFKQTKIYIFVKAYLYQDHRKRLLYMISSKHQKKILFLQPEENSRSQSSDEILNLSDQDVNNEEKPNQTAKVELKNQAITKEKPNEVTKYDKQCQSNPSGIDFKKQAPFQFEQMAVQEQSKEFRKSIYRILQEQQQKIIKMIEKGFRIADISQILSEKVNISKLSKSNRYKSSSYEEKQREISHHIKKFLDQPKFFSKFIQQRTMNGSEQLEKNIISNKSQQKPPSEQNVSEPENTPQQKPPSEQNVSEPENTPQTDKNKPSNVTKKIDLGELEHKKIYFLHLFQFFNEILVQFSSSTNITLSSTFNCSRFLVMNLMCFFMLQTIAFIGQDIKNRHGEQYYNSFLHLINMFQKWSEGIKKVHECIKLSSQKIKNYLDDRKKPSKQKPVNVKKIQLMFENNSSLQKLYHHLNDSKLIENNVDKLSTKFNFDHEFLTEFDVDLTKKIYSEAIQLVIKECCNKIIFERTINNKYAKMTEYEVFFQKFKITLQSFDDVTSIKTTTQEQKETLKNLLAEYTIIHIQNLKCFALVTALPFYSFENFRSIKRKTQSKTLNCSIFKNLDKIYVYFQKKCRLNKEILSASQDQTMKQFYQTYTKNLDELIRFIEEDNFQRKENILKQGFSNQQQKVIENQWPIHDQRMAIFGQKECFSLFYVTHQWIKSPSLQYEDLEKECKNLNEAKNRSESKNKSNKSQVVEKEDNYIKYMRNFQKNMQIILPLYKQLQQEIQQLKQVKNEVNKKKISEKRKKK